jgi:hypothetical protein
VASDLAGVFGQPATELIAAVTLTPIDVYIDIAGPAGSAVVRLVLEFCGAFERRESAENAPPGGAVIIVGIAASSGWARCRFLC